MKMIKHFGMQTKLDQKCHKLALNSGTLLSRERIYVYDLPIVGQRRICLRNILLRKTKMSYVCVLLMICNR